MGTHYLCQEEEQSVRAESETGQDRVGLGEVGGWWWWCYSYTHVYPAHHAAPHKHTVHRDIIDLALDNKFWECQVMGWG